MNELEENTEAFNSISCAEDDKDLRLKNRDLIENFHAAMKIAAGSERGIADDINDNGLEEYFVGGSYVRKLFIPKDTVIVSQLWNKDRFWIIATGDVSITTEVGTKRVQGPHTEIPVFGSRVALYTHEDTLWFAITGCESQNSEDIEKEVIVYGYDSLVFPWDKIDKIEE